MSTATTSHTSDSLRVSDADRDRAIAELSEHFQAGRLTADELDDRTGRALQARTTADLAALFTDLPRRQVPVTSAVPPSPVRSLPARVPVPIAILAVIVLASILSGHPGLIVLVPVVALIIVRRLAGGGRRG